MFSDPLARLVLGEEGLKRLDTDPGQGQRGIMATSLRAFLAVRSRVAEDRLGEAVAAGVRQYLVLGAGLDTFACRNPWPELRIFEVDHPRTQAWKLERFRSAGITASSSTTYVPADFERQSIEGELASRGFDPDRATAISWLGVIPYLEEPTVWATLEWVARIVGDTGHIVFDYGSKPMWWQFVRRIAFRRLSARVAAAGEPFRTLLRPAYVRRRVTELGFTGMDDLGARELNARYFAGRADDLRVRGGGHVVIASRHPRERRELA